jgi:hypothetical protein
LCKSPDANLDRYDVHFVTAGRDLTVVRGLGGTLAYNFDSPDLFAIVAWERGASLTR